MLTALLLTAHGLTFSSLKVELFSRLPQRRFETTVAIFEESRRGVVDYLQGATAAAATAGPLWAIASLALGLSNPFIIALTAALCSFFPFGGNWAAAALSLFWVERSTATLQLLGLAATAFLLHMMQSRFKIGSIRCNLNEKLAAALPAAVGWGVASFSGLFIAATTAALSLAAVKPKDLLPCFTGIPNDDEAKRVFSTNKGIL